MMWMWPYAIKLGVCFGFSCVWLLMERKGNVQSNTGDESFAKRGAFELQKQTLHHDFVGNEKFRLVHR
jgi:hypothetical protein